MITKTLLAIVLTFSTTFAHANANSSSGPEMQPVALSPMQVQALVYAKILSSRQVLFVTQEQYRQIKSSQNQFASADTAAIVICLAAFAFCYLSSLPPKGS